MLTANKLKAALWTSITGRGLLGWLIALIKPAAAGMSMVGNVDLLANYFGAAGRFLNTGWGTLASVALGAIIIGYAVVRANSANEHQSADISEPKESKVSAEYYAIETGVGTDYDFRTRSQYNGVRHVIKVKIINHTRTILTRARLSIVNLDPENAGHRDFPLELDITLAAGENTYVDVASHPEGREADQHLMSLQTSYPGGFLPPAGHGILIWRAQTATEIDTKR